MGVAVLNQTLCFPDPRLSRRDGLVAVGGDLSVPRLLAAYRAGIFPWTANPITWWSPDPRGIFELDAFHVPRSLEKVLRRKPFRISINQAFAEVVKGCAAAAPGRCETWITQEFIDAYTQLHRHGHAHSVECWRGTSLVGGIYGVGIGGLFAGESMFHEADNASKVALWYLVQQLRRRDFGLFDIQMVTPATERLGARPIARGEYLRRLAGAVKRSCDFSKDAGNINDLQFD